MNLEAPRTDSRRPLTATLPFVLVPVLVGLMLLLAGCDDTTEVNVEQPIAFPHKNHLAYFSSGKHRGEMIQMHLKALDEKVPPDELVQGKCTECHDDLPDRKPCAGCHLLFQDEKLRERKDVRACVGCHRKAWSGNQASIPSAVVCAACHAAAAKTASPEEKRLREILARGGDVPWIQLHTVANHVHFSHSAHVRRAGLPCLECHEDMSQKDAPPSRVRVFTMKNCLHCHKENHATFDCVACHK